MSRLQNLPLCTDARMLDRPGSGVATYAQALHAAQGSISQQDLLLRDESSRLGPREGRALRWLRALAPWGVHAEPPLASGVEIRGRDIFRLAQIWFDVHGRLLPVRVPMPPGIMHWSYPVPIRLVGWHNIYTVHDAIPLTAPELTPIDARRHRRLLLRVTAEAARTGAIATVSDDAAREISAALGNPAVPIANCSVAVTRSDDERTLLPAKLQRGGYLLVCGALEPRKNSARIAAAYRSSELGLPLVFAGPAGADDPALARDILGQPGVVRVSGADTPTMTALIARARAVLMPSLAEGFGLPVAEAMTLGTPVLTSQGGALAETAGGAAFTVDPLDVAAMAIAIRRLVDDAPLRAELIAKGLDNARRFTPARFADRLAALYGEVVAREASSH